MKRQRIIVIGAGIGGLTVAALLAKTGRYDVLVLEAQTYAGGCAATFYHKGFRFDTGATVIGGLHDSGPHHIVGDLLDIHWPVRRSATAWRVHLPEKCIVLTDDMHDILRQFPHSTGFWREQQHVADSTWQLAAQGLPWPPINIAEAMWLGKLAISNIREMGCFFPLMNKSVYQWARKHQLHNDKAFMRFLDGQLLISAQTTSKSTAALYGATALDLPRQGIYEVEGGIGNLAKTLVTAIERYGGKVQFRQHVTQICTKNRVVTGVYVRKGRHRKQKTFVEADVIIANMPHESVDALMSPQRMRKRSMGQGAFVLHVGVQSDKLGHIAGNHHQIITSLEGELGEGRSIFVSISPEWDSSRAPKGHRAVTITTHTNVRQWWELYQRDKTAYGALKNQYEKRILAYIDEKLPNFSKAAVLILGGTPITYQHYTLRPNGEVGGLPQTSLFKSRSPKTSSPNIWVVGDTIFPGQSTAAVTLGALRVVKNVERVLS